MNLRMWRLKLYSIFKLNCSNELRRQLRKYGEVNLPKGVFIVDGKRLPLGWIVGSGTNKTTIK